MQLGLSHSTCFVVESVKCSTTHVPLVYIAIELGLSHLIVLQWNLLSAQRHRFDYFKENKLEISNVFDI